MKYYTKYALTHVEEPTGKLLTQSGVPYQWRFAVGPPVKKIVEAANEQSSDLSVVGNQGEGDGTKAARARPCAG